MYLKQLSLTRPIQIYPLSLGVPVLKYGMIWPKIIIIKFRDKNKKKLKKKKKKKNEKKKKKKKKKI